jgi:DNA polymerase sigma
MPFIVGVGDPMSIFNDADPEQKLLQNDLNYRQIEDQFYRDFDASIRQYIEKIASKVNKYKAERDAVLAKIQAIANKVFSNQSPTILMFGSLMTGLALESSDMDIVVQGLNISDR